MEKESPEEIFQRIKNIIGAHNDTEVGEALGIKQQSVTSARKRGKIPPAWISEMAFKYGASADYLLFGEGYPFRKDRELQEMSLIEADKEEIIRTAARLLLLYSELNKYIRETEKDFSNYDLEKRQMKGVAIESIWESLKNALYETSAFLIKIIPKTVEKSNK
jgi:hypothetical protein